MIDKPTQLYDVTTQVGLIYPKWYYKYVYPITDYSIFYCRFQARSIFLMKKLGANKFPDTVPFIMSFVLINPCTILYQLFADIICLWIGGPMWISYWGRISCDAALKFFFFLVYYITTSMYVVLPVVGTPQNDWWWCVQKSCFEMIWPYIYI